MSSDSEESHSSARRNINEENANSGEHYLGQSADNNSGFEENVTGDDGTEDAQEEELESIGSGDNGFTFARVRSRGAQQEEEETASELSFRPKVERAGSVESASTPDDTPSIQVRFKHGNRTCEMLMIHRAQYDRP
jgi:hypothetical protein